MSPKFCPYCGSGRIEPLEPTELMVDDMKWIVYHYECQDCLEIFDKIFINDLNDHDMVEIEIKPK